MKLKLERLVIAVGVCACAPAPGTPAASAAAPHSSPIAASNALPQQNLPAASTAGSATAASPSAPKPDELTAVAIALPGATAPVALDFLFYEAEKARVWVPAGGSGAVDVFDIGKHGFLKVEGFQTVERETHGNKRMVGPSAGAIAGSFAYIGNRATQEICAVDLQTLKKGACLKLADPIDCVEFVPSKQQVWVTTPSTQSLVVLEALPKGVLKQKATIKLEGAPEGYALDEPRGLFLTNLEDKGSTLGIDVTTHAVSATWNAGCAADGPRGVAVDSARGLLFVACTDHVQALDMAHAGALLGKLDTGAGLDNIDYVASTGLLYAAAGKAARVTVAHVDAKGQFEIVAAGNTAVGARNAVADRDGTVYVADPQGAHLLVMHKPSETRATGQ